MGLFDLLKAPDINQGVKEFQSAPGAILLDVRTSEEYRERHIPGSQNIPLQCLDKISGIAAHQNTPIFVYCHSGSRSRQAVVVLSRMGYRNVKNIGGIADWSGKVED